MAPSGPRVAPDGVLIDHVAEFVYESTPRLQTLFRRDEEGYIHAVAQLVQTIAIGGTVVGAKQPGAIECTDKLKSALFEAGRLDLADFFVEEQRTQRLESANMWLASYWEAICSELEPSDETRPRYPRNLRPRYEATTLVPRTKQAPRRTQVRW